MSGTLFTETESDRRAAETDARARGDDPTPRQLVRAIIEPALEACTPGSPSRGLDVLSDFRQSRGEPLRLLDVCAGYGCWSSEARARIVARRLGCHLHITAIEIHEPRRQHLEKWCDEIRIGDWRAQLRDGEEFDIAIGNPDFKLLLAPDGDPDESMPAVLLRHAPAVLLLHQTTNFQRGMVGVAAWRANPAAREWRVPGSVGFRGRGPGAGTDSRCYQASLWTREHVARVRAAEQAGEKPPPTTVEMLDGPPDGGASWRWVVPPGSEEPSAELPAAPGWRP